MYKRQAHPGLGEEGKYHSKEDEHPLPDGTPLTYALVGNQNCGKTTDVYKRQQVAKAQQEMESTVKTETTTEMSTQSTTKTEKKKTSRKKKAKITKKKISKDKNGKK